MKYCNNCKQVEPDYSEAQPLLDTVLAFYNLGSGMYGAMQTWYDGLLQYFWHYPKEAEYCLRLLGKIYQYFNYETTSLYIKLDHDGSIDYWMLYIYIHDDSIDYHEARKRQKRMDKTYFTSNKWGIRQQRITTCIR